MSSIADPAGAAPEQEPAPEPPGPSLPRLSGPLDVLIARGVALRESSHLIALSLRPREAARGGLAAIGMPIDSRCADCAAARSPTCAPCLGTGIVRELHDAWLTIPPGVRDGAILAAAVELPDAIAVVRFRVLIDQPD